MWRTILAACFLALAATARADEAPLYQQEPYDTITLDDANRNAELKVRPLDLPDRRVPAKPNPTAELEIRLLDRPRTVYKVAWGNIVAVELFEDRVLAEAEGLVAAKKLDAAYPYYDFLERRYPKMPALAASYAKYLMAGARESFIKGNYEECLALSWELYRRDPNFKGAATAILRADDKLDRGTSPRETLPPPVRCCKRRPTGSRMARRRFRQLGPKSFRLGPPRSWPRQKIRPRRSTFPKPVDWRAERWPPGPRFPAPGSSPPPFVASIPK